jgi:alpha/beta superfamily hydrolase
MYMPVRAASVLLGLLFHGAMVFGAVPIQLASGIERLANGNTLITDAGSAVESTARILEVDSLGHLVWAYVRSDIPWAHTARRLANGNTLVSATFANRVAEVDALGNTVWEFVNGLSYPNEAFRLSDGNTLITDRDNDRVIEVDADRNVVWSYTNLLAPHNGNRLANGNTLICDSDRSRVIEVSPAGEIVWQYATGLDWGRCAERLANGNTLITDSRHNRVIEVDSAGTIRWTFSAGLQLPYMATRLASGNTLISTDSRVIEVDPAGNTVWQYPPSSVAVTVETLWVTGPTSGCSLYVHIHRPATSGPDHRIPAVILVPDEARAGTTFDESQLTDHIASDGFAVLHFDAEGRGRSNGTEDYNGYVHQDGLQACAAFLAQQPYVDTARLGIYSQGYGVVTATGMLARHSLPRVKFLLDFEGPSDRYQVCSDSGGHVPVSPDSESFWMEREAERLIKHVASAYLRIQTATDHTNRIPDNRHCVALIDSATAVAHGGAGIAVWTRVNDSVMNGENLVYTVTQPPEWIEDIEEGHLLCRELLYLHELARREFPGAVSGSSFIAPRSSFSISPNPCRASAVLHFTTGPLDHSTASLHLYDASGCLVLAQPVSSSSFTLHASSLRAGVYLVRLAAAGGAATAKLVVR